MVVQQAKLDRESKQQLLIPGLAQVHTSFYSYTGKAVPARNFIQLSQYQQHDMNDDAFDSFQPDKAGKQNIKTVKKNTLTHIEAH